MKTVRIPETNHLNKGGIAAGDEIVINELRRHLVEKGFDVGQKMAMDVGEPGVITVYQPPPELSLGLRTVRRFTFREMLDNDRVFQNRLNAMFRKKGGAKLRRWSDKEQRVVTEEVTMSDTALREIMPPPSVDPHTGLPLL